MTTKQNIAICTICGYQWDCEDSSTFSLYCPVCDTNMVHWHAPEKEQLMGEDYDGQPWW